MVRGTALFQCQICDKRFTSKSLYTSHQKKAHGIKKWECQYCHRRFAERGTLTNHIRTHTKETPFGCDVCGKKFSHRATLLNHKKIHDPWKEHECEYCKKRFHRKSNMKRHIQVVHFAKGKKGRSPYGRNRGSPLMNGMFSALHSSSAASSTSSSPLMGFNGVSMPPPPLPLDQMLQHLGQNLYQKRASFHSLLGAMAKQSSTVPSYCQPVTTFAQMQSMPGKVISPSGLKFPPPFPPADGVKEEVIDLELQTIPVPPHVSHMNGSPQIKEEPLDEHYGFGVIPKPTLSAATSGASTASTMSGSGSPSLDSSRSTSPIIGEDDMMMKQEDMSPMVSPAFKLKRNDSFNFLSMTRTQNLDMSAVLPDLPVPSSSLPMLPSPSVTLTTSVSFTYPNQSQEKCTPVPVSN